MNILSGIPLQILIDIALLMAIVVLIWRINSNLKKPLLKSQQDLMKELKQVMKESQVSSDIFLQALEKSRIALKEIALELDIKEKRVRSLLSDKDNDGNLTSRNRISNVHEEKYQQVVDLIRKGYSEEKTAEITGFSEAEIGLIIDLFRIKNEKN